MLLENRIRQLGLELPDPARLPPGRSAVGPVEIEAELAIDGER
jgi:hypothetical protein